MNHLVVHLFYKTRAELKTTKAIKMKAIINILTILFLSVPMFSFAHNGEPEDGKEINSRDQQVELTWAVAEDRLYFKLNMLNESKDGFYALVKLDQTNGEFESIDITQMTANTINKPIMYSLVDKNIPDEDAVYVLYRVTDDKEEVQSWRYCSQERSLCPWEASLAVNEEEGE